MKLLKDIQRYLKEYIAEFSVMVTAGA